MYWDPRVLMHAMTLQCNWHKQGTRRTHMSLAPTAYVRVLCFAKTEKIKAGHSAGSNWPTGSALLGNWVTRPRWGRTGSWYSLVFKCILLKFPPSKSGRKDLGRPDRGTGRYRLVDYWETEKASSNLYTLSWDVLELFRDTKKINIYTAVVSAGLPTKPCWL
jgi:hypothetical protein